MARLVAQKFPAEATVDDAGRRAGKATAQADEDRQVNALRGGRVQMSSDQRRAISHIELGLSVFGKGT